jgi:hypothetical protein
MCNVSIRECFSVLNVSVVCIRNTARSKSIPLLCTHVDPYKFSTVHPPRFLEACMGEAALPTNPPKAYLAIMLRIVVVLFRQHDDQLNIGVSWMEVHI